jgi:AcrR family transcriptional regulator
MSLEPSAAGVPRRVGRPRAAGLDDRLLEATLVALKRDGYAHMRVDEVAEIAGVAKTTLYRRWPSKGLLVAAAVGGLYLDRVQTVDHGDLRADLAALLDETYQLLFDGPGRVLEDLVRESGASRELAGVVKSTTEVRRRAFHLAMTRGVARGELDPEVNHDLLVDLLVGPLWTRLLVTEAVLSSDEVMSLVDMVLDGVQPRRG